MVRELSASSRRPGDGVCKRDSSATHCDRACIACFVHRVIEPSHRYYRIGDPDLIIMQQDTDPSAWLDQPPDSTLCINRIVIRVPPSWPKSLPCGSRSWKGSLHCQTSRWMRRKFTVLSRFYAAEVEDVVTNPPPTCRYDRIIAELMRVLSLSEEQRVCHFLMHEETGDRRPTLLLRHLRTLAGPSVPSDFLRTLLTNRLPPNVQAIIAKQSQVALDYVVQLAEKIRRSRPLPVSPV
jgi:hypothetical protein